VLDFVVSHSTLPMFSMGDMNDIMHPNAKSGPGRPDLRRINVSVILSNSVVLLILDIVDQRTHGPIRDSTLLQLSNVLIVVHGPIRDSTVLQLSNVLIVVLLTRNDVWLILGQLYIIFQCFAVTMLLSLRFLILIDTVLINFGTKQGLKTTQKLELLKTEVVY